MPAHSSTLCLARPAVEPGSGTPLEATSIVAWRPSNGEAPLEKSHLKFTDQDAPNRFADQALSKLIKARISCFVREDILALHP